MRTIHGYVHKLAASVLALAVMSLATQAMAQTTILSSKVVRLKGAARYSVDGKTWQRLERGTILKPGTVIQTAEDSYVDVQMGTREVKPATPVLNNGTLYQPQEPAANVVRIFESSVLAIDKLTSTPTGVDNVEETQLDLRAGRIMGSVKKLSAASKYEVKIPNGVAGIRGTTYVISSSGVIKVLEGSVVIAIVSADGSVVTKVVSAGYQYDPMTQTLSQIPAVELKTLIAIESQVGGPLPSPPTYIVKNPTIIYISPLGGENGQGQNGNGQGQNGQGGGGQGGNNQGP
jgi:hypothetical protein